MSKERGEEERKETEREEDLREEMGMRDWRVALGGVQQGEAWQ